MLPFHKPLLLGIVEHFEQALMHPVDAFGGAITWEDTASLDLYCQKLERSMQRIVDRNTSAQNASRVPKSDGRPV